MTKGADNRLDSSDGISLRIEEAALEVERPVFGIAVLNGVVRVNAINQNLAGGMAPSPALFAGAGWERILSADS